MLEFENIKELKSIISESKKKRVKGISVFQSVFRMIVFLVTYGLIMIFVTIFTYKILSHSAKLVKMPNVVNKKFLEAYMILHNLNLNVKVQLKNYDTIPYGVVVAQSIPYTKLIKERRMLTLTVSQGKSTIVLPTIQSNQIEYRSLYVVFQVPKPLPQSLFTNTSATNVSVKIYVSDEGQYKNELVYSDTSALGEIIKVPLKATGRVHEKIFLNQQLYLERDE